MFEDFNSIYLEKKIANLFKAEKETFPNTLCKIGII